MSTSESMKIFAAPPAHLQTLALVSVHEVGTSVKKNGNQVWWSGGLIFCSLEYGGITRHTGQPRSEYGGMGGAVVAPISLM